MRNLLFLVLIITSLTIFSLAAIAWRKRHSSGMAAAYLAICLLGVSIYNFGYAFEMISNVLPDMMFWVRIQHFGILAIIPSWFLFSLIITGRESYITQQRVLVLWIIPLLVFIASQTLGSLNWMHINPHVNTIGAFPTFDYERGPLVYLFVAYFSLCLAVTTIFYSLMLIWAVPGFRRQAGIYWVSSLIPWLAGIVYNFGLTPNNLDITPLSFSISGILLGIGFLQFHLLDILPLARDVIFEGINEGVLVLDTQNIIVDLNPRFLSMLPAIQNNYFGRPASEVLSCYPELIDQIKEDASGAVELDVVIYDDVFFYRSSLSPLLNGQKELVGKIVMLYDISRIKILMHELEELAQLDGLTGIFNRQHFFKLATAEMYRIKRYGGAISLIMLDLDHFKKINDTFGHAAGDGALSMVINTMRPLLRKSDIIGRVGGEEFLILLPQTEPEICLVIIERLRAAIEREDFIYEDTYH